MIEKIFEKITNNFYTDEPVSVIITKEGGANYLSNTINISEEIMEVFRKGNLPRFSVYYHELAHHLYSSGMFKHEAKWRAITSGPLEWHQKYHHLINWIEDFYIEETLLKQYPYLSDTIKCLKLLTPEYNPQHIKYTFNHYYMYGVPNNALTYDDQLVFVDYINELLGYRRHQLFGEGVVTNLKIKPGRDTLFAVRLVEFYNWCVSKGIFEPDEELPDLTHPTSYITVSDPDGAPDGTQDGDRAQTPDGQGSAGTHSGQVGKIIKENFITKGGDSTKIPVELERSIINRELLNMTQVYQGDQGTRDGLFNTGWKESYTIQPKVNVPHFFNPYKLMEQNLFYERKRTFTEVSIFRDISGSVSYQTHKLMDQAIALLMDEIPVDVHYYLYASGEISILEVPYVPWPDMNNVPEVYENNELFQKLGGGTNSDAIADVITQQLNDRHFNIILTDGDLNALMRRDNIAALLENVYVIGVHGDPGTEYTAINTVEDLPKVIEGLSKYERL